MNRWLKVATAARKARLNERTLRRWCASGKIPASKRGGKLWWIDVQGMIRRAAQGNTDLEDLLESFD